MKREWENEYLERSKGKLQENHEMKVKENYAIAYYIIVEKHL